MTQLISQKFRRNVDNFKMQKEGLELGYDTSFGGYKHKPQFTKKPSSKRVQKKLKESRAWK